MSTLQAAVEIIKDNRDIALSDTTRDGGIQRAIREAITLLRGKRFWFLQKTATIALGLNSSTITLPSDFAMSDSFDLLYSGQRFTHGRGFNLLDYQDLKRLYWIVEPIPTGKPTACALLNRTLRLDRRCDISGASINLTYFSQDAVLPATPSATSVFFGADSFDVVVSLAEHIFERRTMQNMEADTVITQSFQDTLLQRHEQFDRARVL